MPKAFDMKTATDVDLIKVCLDGNINCFEELVNRYKNLVYSIVLRMTTDREEANDLAQEIFIKAFQNLDKYSQAFKFSTWIMRIATNHVIDYRRKARKEFVSFEEACFQISAAGTPEGDYIQKERKESLQELLDELPGMYKVPIILYHEQGLSYQEISEKLGEPLSKIKNRIFRGRKMLKSMIGKLKEGGYFEM